MGRILKLWLARGMPLSREAGAWNVDRLVGGRRCQRGAHERYELPVALGLPMATAAACAPVVCRLAVLSSRERCFSYGQGMN